MSPVRGPTEQFHGPGNPAPIPARPPSTPGHPHRVPAPQLCLFRDVTELESPEYIFKHGLDAQGVSHVTGVLKGLPLRSPEVRGLSYEVRSCEEDVE